MQELTFKTYNTLYMYLFFRPWFPQRWREDIEEPDIGLQQSIPVYTKYV